MGNSLKLFKVRGIDIRLHFTFPLILIWAAIQFGALSGNFEGAIFGIIAVTLLFVLVTLHELGHSFAAQYYGVPVKQIVLSPIGGVAQLARIPDKPLQELVIAIAGPAVNIIIAILMSLALLIPNHDLANINLALSGEAGLTFTAVYTYIFVSNIFLAVFNLLPAFPMDGGRILRALLALRLDYTKATNIAVLIGRVFAVGLGIFGLSNGNFFQVMIAFFIFGAGSQEAKYTQIRHTLKKYTVGQVYTADAYRLEPNYTLQQAANLLAYTKQQDFPVVLGDRLVGFLSGSQLQAALQTHSAYEYVTAVMQRNITPVTPNTDLFTVQNRMIAENLEALPVVSVGNGRFLGIITRQNFNRINKQSTNNSQEPIIVDAV